MLFCCWFWSARSFFSLDPVCCGVMCVCVSCVRANERACVFLCVFVSVYQSVRSCVRPRVSARAWSCACVWARCLRICVRARVCVWTWAGVCFKMLPLSLSRLKICSRICTLWQWTCFALGFKIKRKWIKVLVCLVHSPSLNSFLPNLAAKIRFLGIGLGGWSKNNKDTVFSSCHFLGNIITEMRIYLLAKLVKSVNLFM